MEATEKGRIIGRVELVVRDGRTGRIKARRTGKNLIVDVGRAGIAAGINGSGWTAFFTYIAVGESTTAPAAGQTTLITEITTSGLARAAATASRITTSSTNDTASLSKTFSVSGPKTVTEVGAFNASSGGVMVGRKTFTGVAVDSPDSLQITYTFQIS